MAGRVPPIVPLSRRKAQNVRNSLRSNAWGHPAAATLARAAGPEVGNGFNNADDSMHEIQPIPPVEEDQNEAPVAAAVAPPSPNAADELAAQIERQEYDLNIPNANDAQRNAHQLWLDKWTTLASHHMRSDKVTCADSLLMLFAKARQFSWTDNSLTSELRQVRMENGNALPECYPNDARGFWDVRFVRWLHYPVHTTDTKLATNIALPLRQPREGFSCLSKHEMQPRICGR